MIMTPTAHVRRSAPQPRKGVYDLYWLFASRRQAAFEARLTGKKWPWTEDPILQTYKFCNVYRAADRVSQYMIKEVAYGYDRSSTVADRIFQIAAFRTFSKIQTWRAVQNELGGSPRLEHLRSGAFERALDRVKASTGGLYTGAFILCANKVFGFDEKHRNHVGLFKHMFLENAFAERALQSPSFEGVVKLIESFPLMGPFMAYQTAIDLNYSDLFDYNENDYTQAGPGALRGLKKAFLTLGDYTAAETIVWMVERQDHEFKRLGLPFNGLFGRRLHAIDCQGLFCELDKYCREAVPELTSARSRIKAQYRGTPEEIDLYFPPKWAISSGARLKAAIMGNDRPMIRQKRGKHKADLERDGLAVGDFFR